MPTGQKLSLARVILFRSCSARFRVSVWFVSRHIGYGSASISMSRVCMNIENYALQIPML